MKDSISFEDNSWPSRFFAITSTARIGPADGRVDRGLDVTEAKSFREKLRNRDLLQATACALEYDYRFRTKFVNDLAARAAGRARHALVVHHRDRLNDHSRA